MKRGPDNSMSSAELESSLYRLNTVAREKLQVYPADIRARDGISELALKDPESGNLFTIMEEHASTLPVPDEFSVIENKDGKNTYYVFSEKGVRAEIGDADDGRTSEGLELNSPEVEEVSTRLQRSEPTEPYLD